MSLQGESVEPTPRAIHSLLCSAYLSTTLVTHLAHVHRFTSNVSFALLLTMKAQKIMQFLLPFCNGVPSFAYKAQRVMTENMMPAILGCDESLLRRMVDAAAAERTWESRMPDRLDTPVRLLLSSLFATFLRLAEGIVNACYDSDADFSSCAATAAFIGLVVALVGGSPPGTRKAFAKLLAAYMYSSSAEHAMLGRNVRGMTHAYGLCVQAGRFWRECSLPVPRYCQLQTLAMFVENPGFPSLLKTMENCPAWAKGAAADFVREYSEDTHWATVPDYLRAALSIKEATAAAAF
jgi:hypothetical protein